MKGSPLSRERAFFHGQDGGNKPFAIFRLITYDVI